MQSLVGLSVEDMRKGLLAREFSAQELTDAHLKRIHSTNTQFNSFLQVSDSAAREAAEQADKRIAADGERTPQLTGIPVAIKDMLVTKGIETTCASKILKGFVPPYDCTAVSRLKQQGAIVVGKTNLDEFAMGSSNEHSAYGPVRNPWDPSCVPGGSSGGSAVAVSLGQAPLSLGTDTGGSIRQPASLTGVVGLKPTYGRVSRYGAVAFASSLDQIGPFGRTVADVAMIMKAIAGLDDQDSTSMNTPVPDYYSELKAAEQEDLKGLRIGVPKEYFLEGLDPEIEAAVRKTIAQLQDQGAEVVDISLPHTEYTLPVYYIIAPAEAASNLARYDGIRYGFRTDNAESLTEVYERTRATGFGAEVKRRILIGNYVLSAGYYDAYYRKGQQVRTLIINDFKAAFHNKCDVIVAPVSPTTAFKLGEKTDSPLAMYLADVFTVPVNLAGLPGLSVPCALDKKKLPIGAQVIGPPFAESLLLRVGRAIERNAQFDVHAMTRAHG